MPTICVCCKNELPKGAKFCSDCGTPVPKDKKEDEQIPLILMADEAMKMLRISRTMFYQLLGREKDPIPYFPIGKHKRFITEEILAWAKRNQNIFRLDKHSRVS